MRRFTSKIGWLVLIAGLSACEGVIGIRDLGSSAKELVVDSGPADVPTQIEPDAGQLDTGGHDGDWAPSFKLVFVTSATSDGLVGGLEGADARCNSAAVRADLPGKWVAWASDSATDAIDRIEFRGSYRLLDGREVVAGYSQLGAGALSNAIDVTELGVRVTDGSALTWTGTLPTGRRSDHCKDWTTNDTFTFGTAGTVTKSDSYWTKNFGQAIGVPAWSCATQAHLYCFQR